MRKIVHSVDALCTIQNWLKLATLILSLSLIPIFAPTIERHFFPPVTSFTIDDVALTDGGAFVSGMMTKARENCYPLEVSAHAVNIENGEGDLIFFAHSGAPTEATPWHSRPAGPQSWGPWLFNRPTKRRDMIIVSVIHRCHEFWKVRSELTRVVAASVFPSEEVYEQQGLAPDVKEGEKQ